MNERIKELWEEAAKTTQGDSWEEQIKFMERYTLLIVWECIEQASIGNGHGNNQWDRALTFASKNIKEHFGVEE